MIVLYILAIVSLFLFSYTQVDLSLTLSRASIFQTIEKSFQHVGYFDRPMATNIYLVILVAFFVLYVVSIWRIRKKKMDAKTVWIISILTGFILLFSYPAFSYDLFNYMFYAKEILVYHKNPYTTIPLDFAGTEPWLSFLHWTHVPNVFSPLWTALTVPMYLLGFGYFLTTMWSVKLLAVAGYLFCIYFIEKVVSAIDRKQSTLAMALVALNPLVIIESTVSAHNDIVMMAVAMASLYALTKGENFFAFVLMSISAGIKSMTAFVVPVVLFGYQPFVLLFAILTGFTAALIKREIMPWYFIWIIPFVALQPKKRAFVWFMIAASFGLLLRYAPFFYYGNWNAPVPTIEFWVTIIPIGIAAVVLLLKKSV